MQRPMRYISNMHLFYARVFFDFAIFAVSLMGLVVTAKGLVIQRLDGKKTQCGHHILNIDPMGVATAILVQNRMQPALLSFYWRGDIGWNHYSWATHEVLRFYSGDWILAHANYSEHFFPPQGGNCRGYFWSCVVRITYKFLMYAVEVIVHS
jgi:hypothetical protein